MHTIKTSNTIKKKKEKNLSRLMEEQIPTKYTQRTSVGVAMSSQVFSFPFFFPPLFHWRTHGERNNTANVNPLFFPSKESFLFVSSPIQPQIQSHSRLSISFYVMMICFSFSSNRSNRALRDSNRIKNFSRFFFFNKDKG